MNNQFGISELLVLFCLWFPVLLLRAHKEILLSARILLTPGLYTYCPTLNILLFSSRLSKMNWVLLNFNFFSTKSQMGEKALELIFLWMWKRMVVFYCNWREHLHVYVESSKTYRQDSTTEVNRAFGTHVIITYRQEDVNVGIYNQCKHWIK